MKEESSITTGVNPEHLITPGDLYNAQLKTNLFGGYSKNQVDMLLEHAADTVEILSAQLGDLRAQAAESQKELAKYREMEASLRTALVSSQKMGESMISSAKLQADALIEEARLAKARAVFKMEQLPQTLMSEIHRLIEGRERLRNDIASILKAHEELLTRIPRAEEAGDAFVRENIHSISVDTATRESEEASPSQAEWNRAEPVIQSAFEREKEEGYVDL